MAPDPRGREWHFRELTPLDGATLDHVLTGMSPRSRQRRFHSAVQVYLPSMRRQLLAVDGQRHLAVVAEVPAASGTFPIAIGRYVLVGDRLAEIALEVVDHWQGRGVGRSLAREVLDRAHSKGVRQVTAQVVGDNTPALSLARTALDEVAVAYDSGSVTLTGVIPPRSSPALMGA